MFRSFGSVILESFSARRVTFTFTFTFTFTSTSQVSRAWGLVDAGAEPVCGLQLDNQVHESSTLHDLGSSAASCPLVAHCTYMRIIR